MTLSQLPSVHQLIQSPELCELPHDFAVELARKAIEAKRNAILSGQKPLPKIEDLITVILKQIQEPQLRHVINATGIIIHTNLGRAPYPKAAVSNVVSVMRGYCNLELDLESGKRGGRLNGVCDRIARITGAESAIVVNNCAAATLLAVSALASEKEVVVSRGELVEIGGSFRIPDVIEQGGAKLVAVGTTNRTRVEDYHAALSGQTGALLRVHPSNYRVVGFTERPDRKELAALARQKNIPLVDDLGSGLLHQAPEVPYASELYEDESVSKAISDGADLITFSGDKLLGGAQAGFIVGGAKWVEKCRKHALYRALRVDKLTLAALEACLMMMENHQHDQLPVWKMMQRGADRVRQEAEAIAAEIPGSHVESETSYSGGGALPDRGLSDWAVVIPHARPNSVARALRMGMPAIVLRVAKDALRIHPRTLLEGEAAEVVKRIVTVL